VRRAVAAVFGLLAAVAVSTATWSDPVCRLPRLAHADFAQQPDGTLLLPVSVNGQTEYFSLGGGAHSFIYEADADRLNFGHHHYEADDGLYFGEDEVKLRRTTDLMIGKVRWRDFEFYPMHKDRPAGQIAIGSLGMNFLASAQLDVEINTSARAINFIAPGACARPPWVPDGQGRTLAPANGETSLPVALDGRNFSGIFSTASLQSSIDVRAFAEAFGHAAEDGLIREFNSLTVDETAIAHPVVNVFTYENRDARDYVERRARALNPYASFPPVVRRGHADGILWIGLAELDRMRLYFTFKQHKVFATPILGAPNTGIAPPEPAPGPDDVEQHHH